MFYQGCFGIKCKETLISFINRYFTSISNKISRNTLINFVFVLIEFCTLNEVHENMVLLVLNTDKSLNDC